MLVYTVEMKTQHAVDNQIALALGVLSFCMSKDSPLCTANKNQIAAIVDKLQSAQSQHRNERKPHYVDR